MYHYQVVIEDLLLLIIIIILLGCLSFISVAGLVIKINRIKYTALQIYDVFLKSRGGWPRVIDHHFYVCNA